jgi:hypothetical protein
MNNKRNNELKRHYKIIFNYYKRNCVRTPLRLHPPGEEANHKVAAFSKKRGETLSEKSQEDIFISQPLTTDNEFFHLIRFVQLKNKKSGHNALGKKQ